MGSTLSRLLIAFHLACLFLQAFPALSQEKYLIQHFTNENGLPANSIQGIELDKKNGFLWVGTQAGLVRFDGRNFRHFGSVKNAAPAFRTTVIARNREGTIYCEDDNLSVYRITQNKPEWITTDSFGLGPFLIRDDHYPARPLKRMKKWHHANRAAFLHTPMVFHDASGDSSSFSFIYAGQIYHYSAVADSLQCIGHDTGFQDILKLDGRVYFVRKDLTVWEYDDSLRQLLPVRVNNMPTWSSQGAKPRYIWQQGMKEPLLIYQQAIWKLQRTGPALQLQPLCQECCPADVHINTIQIWEEQDILFLGSKVNGLYVVRSPFARSITTDAVTIEAGKAEYAQAEIIPGIIATAYGLSFSTQGKPFPRKAPFEFHPFGIYQNQQGDYWYYSKDTIIHFQRPSGRTVKIAVNDGAEKMVFAETRNRVFVISDMAIAAITGDEYRLLYKLPLPARVLKNSLHPDAAVEWKPGVLAIATEKLVLYNTEKGGAPDTVLIPGVTAKVRALLKYGNYLLIGTYGQGFYMYKDGVVKKMPLDKNQYLSFSHCFVPDDKGFCWISTNNGLFKVSMHTLATAFENNLDEIYYHYFGRNDGMITTELNGGCQPCALSLSNGYFSFPTMRGLLVVDPRQRHIPPPAGQLFIEEVSADAVPYQPDDSSLHVLRYPLRNLRLRVTLPQFGNPENIYFSYKLAPYHDAWESQDILQNNTLQFGGLKPGSYTLYLRVRNGFEPGQFRLTVVKFSILPPWYQTWWFYLLCVLGFIALIGGLVKWRTAWISNRKKELQLLVDAQTKNIATQSRQLEHQLGQLQSQQKKLEEDNRIKARLIGIISHDMISPIRFMGFLAKRLRNTFSPADQAYQTADSFVNVSHELETLSVNMLNWISFHHDPYSMKPEQFNLYALVNESTGIAATLAREKGIHLYNDIPEGVFIGQYRQAIGIIVYNLAMNAMKYTEQGEVRITGRPDGDHFLLTVLDTGIGMSPQLVDLLNSRESFISAYSTDEIKKFQFGYLIIKDLLQVVRGTLQVESILNKGTQVIIRFLLLEGDTNEGDQVK